MDNCIVTRAFRGASLFLVALHNGNGYQWFADRAQALRMPSGAALDVARAASDFDPTEPAAVVVDPAGHVLGSARMVYVCERREFETLVEAQTFADRFYQRDRTIVAITTRTKRARVAS